MADLPPSPHSNSATDDDTRVRPDRGSPPGTPRWVKVFVIIALVLVLLLVIMMFTDIGGEHGPGRHMPSGDAVETPSGDLGGYTPPIEHKVQQP